MIVAPRGFEVYEEESADLAAKLVERISFAQGRLSTQDQVLAQNRIAF